GLAKGLSLLVAASVWVNCSGRKVAPTPAADLAVPPNLAKAFEVNEQSESEKKKDSKTSAKEAKKTKGSKQAKNKTVIPSFAEGKLKQAEFVIPNRRPNMDPIWVGEKVWMDVTWLATKAGEFLLEVLPFKSINGRKVYDLKGSARTSDL